MLITKSPPHQVVAPLTEYEEALLGAMAREYGLTREALAARLLRQGLDALAHQAGRDDEEACTDD